MYLQHFGLREPPFALTPDTSYFLNRAGYQDALNVLLVALRSGEGFVKVVGEVGTGKTILCRKLVNSLGDEFVSAYIHNPFLDPLSLLKAIADDLQISLDGVEGNHELLKRIDTRLLELNGAGKHVVVCMDEVQAMPVETVEALRLLTNLETEKRKLLQVVLFGQPELDGVLESPSVRQLRQRITFSYRLLPMNRTGLDAYIGHRLQVAGYEGPPLFSRRALERVFSASNGIPRLINILSHKAMMVAFGKGAKQVAAGDVRAAVDDMLRGQTTNLSGWRVAWFRLRWLFASVVLVVSTLVGAGLTGGISGVIGGP